MKPVRFAYAGFLLVALVPFGNGQTERIDTYAKLLEASAKVEKYGSLPVPERVTVLPLSRHLITEARNLEVLLPEYDPIRSVKKGIDAIMDRIEGDPTKEEIDELRALIDAAQQTLKSASPVLERRVHALVAPAIRAFELGLSSKDTVESSAAKREFAAAFAEEFQTVDSGGVSCLVGASAALAPVSLVFSDFARKLARRRPEIFVEFARGQLKVECEGLEDRSVEVLAEVRKGEVIPLVNACLAANDYVALHRGLTAVALWPRLEWLPMAVTAVKRKASTGIGESVGDLVRAYGVHGIRAFGRIWNELSEDSKLRLVWSLWQFPSPEAIQVLERSSKDSDELATAALNSINRMFDKDELEDRSPNLPWPTQRDWLGAVRIAQGLTRHANPDVRDYSHDVLGELREYGNAAGYR